MTDTNELDTERDVATAKTHREVKRELLARLDRAADATLAMFPPGAVGTDAHKTAYDAVGSMLGAVSALLVATPASAEFRRVVLDVVKDAWEISSGATAHDDAVRQALAIAEQDNRPEKPPTKTGTTTRSTRSNKAGGK